jgi:hypothetical protein
MRLETLIGHEEEGEECFIIDCLKEAMENAGRVESLYISVEAELSERLEAVEETISILKRAITNTLIGVSTYNPKVPKLKSFDGARISKELENFL